MRHAVAPASASRSSDSRVSLIRGALGHRVQYDIYYFAATSSVNICETDSRTVSKYNRYGTAYNL